MKFGPFPLQGGPATEQLSAELRALERNGNVWTHSCGRTDGLCLCEETWNGSYEAIDERQARPYGSYDRALERRGYLTDYRIAAGLGIPYEGRGMICCPAHDDRLKSLSWRWSEDRLLLHCFAGCTWLEIRAAT